MLQPSTYSVGRGIRLRTGASGGIVAVVAETLNPAQVLSTLRSGDVAVEPTERWGPGWNPLGEHLTREPCVYGIYGREVAVSKWMTPEVRELIERYPGDVGRGGLPGFEAFVVPNTDVKGLGSWILLYVGESGRVASARVNNYFGQSAHLTRELGGQSFHLMLTLLFGVPVDPRVTLNPKAPTVIDVVRGSLSLTLEARMREMRFGYVQARTPDCTCEPPACDRSRCICRKCSERHLIGARTGIAPLAGWPSGARPLLNSRW